MEPITLVLGNGRSVAFEVETSRQGPAYFVLGIRRSGSSLVNSLCEALAKANGHHFLDVGGRFFFQNVPVPGWRHDPALPQLLLPGNVYGGFRELPYGLLNAPLFRDGPKLLLVRDPRDALVSEYFSTAYSHPIPRKDASHSDVTDMMSRNRERALEVGLEQHVLRNAPRMGQTLAEYQVLGTLPSTKVLRYEDYIFNKAQLIRVIAAHFGWRAPDKLVGLIMEWADVRPSSEDPQAFIRRVAPGDHREKLSAAAIARLGQVLAEPMGLFGYS